ncbi:MAG: Mur ligase family protein [Bacillota bacterium]|nr:Mur ligase family protein [Bacillota bacterium]
MNLSEVLKNVEIRSMQDALPEGYEIRGVSCDSREISEGWIFVANKGKILNGEDYIPEAVRKGAVAVVTESDSREIPEAVCHIVVPSTRNALSVMAANMMGRPADKLAMIGITGSNGKTSTSFMVDGILRAAGVPAGLLGTVFARTGKRVEASILTTPHPSNLQLYLSDMVESGFRACTMEVSSIAVNMRRVHGVHYDVFAFINISREHIDDHGDFETYYNLKASVVKGLGRESICVLYADDEQVSRLAHETSAKVLYFSDKEKRGDCYLERLDLSTGRANFTMNLLGESIDISLKVSGYHNVVNALAAATIATAVMKSGKNNIEISPAHIKAGLEGYSGVERRFECIYDREFKIFDDHFANPGNIDVTFETMHQMRFDGFHMCYAVRGSRGVTVNRENVEAMLPHLKRLNLRSFVATASVEDVGYKDEVTPDEKAVFLACMADAGIEVVWFDRLKDAVVYATDLARPGDVLLLAGCQGMDSGGHVALQHLSAKKADDSILNPIRNRVCGSFLA